MRKDFQTSSGSRLCTAMAWKVPKHDLPINNKMRAPSAARNFRTRAEIQNDETAVQTNRSPDSYAPHRPPPGSSRWQANKHLGDASSPAARCFCRASSEKRIDDTK